MSVNDDSHIFVNALKMLLIRINQCLIETKLQTKVLDDSLHDAKSKHHD